MKKINDFKNSALKVERVPNVFKNLIQIGTLFSYWVIYGAVDLGFQFDLYG